MAHQVRSAFSKVFGSSPHKLGLQQVYDVSHNIAKQEVHTLPDGSTKRVLVHRSVREGRPARRSAGALWTAAPAEISPPTYNHSGLLQAVMQKPLDYLPAAGLYICMLNHLPSAGPLPLPALPRTVTAC